LLDHFGDDSMDRSTIALVAGIAAVSGFWGGVALIGFLSLMGVPAPHLAAPAPSAIPETIEAESFVVVDKHRRVLAVLGVGPREHDPSLFLFGKNGGAAIYPHQLYFDLNGDPDPRVHLLLDENGRPSLTLSNGHHPAAALGAAHLQNDITGSVEETAPSSLTLFDKRGKLIWRAP
jgi:hypothetical protein